MDSCANIYLIGPMGSGKTAVGRQLALRTHREFLDTDQEIERRTGVDIPYIFEKEGEAGFRERESEVIADLCGRELLILATGGGAILAESNRRRLAESGVVIHLETTVDEQLKRTQWSSNRPLLMNDDPRGVLEALRAQRQPLYEEIADYTFDTTGKRVRTVAAAIAQTLERDGRLALQS